jgi:hypothetical protein
MMILKSTPVGGTFGETGLQEDGFSPLNSQCHSGLFTKRPVAFSIEYTDSLEKIRSAYKI